MKATTPVRLPSRRRGAESHYAGPRGHPQPLGMRFGAGPAGVPMSREAAARSALRICCGAGNLARGRLSGGCFAPCASLRSRGRRLKTGCSQDWLPHDFVRTGVKKYAALGRNGRATVLAILLACCTAVSAAETAAERGKRVVDEALRALGGEAFLHMQDRLESGRGYGFYREQLSGLAMVKIYTRYLAPVPGQVAIRERDSQGKNEDSVVLFTENGAWEVTFRGARPLADLRYANYKDSTLRNIFYILRQRLDEPGLAFYSRGMDMYENRPVEMVDITDAANRTVTVYFDQLTKLPTRQVFKRRNPEYKDFDTEVTVYSKYRDVGGGVQWPCATLRERNGEKILEVYSESVVINRGLKDDLFTLPGNLKLLPQAK